MGQDIPMAETQIDQYCGGIFQTNGYLVRTGDEAWLFDAPEGITDWLLENEVQLNGLILTHQHHDHILDVGRIQETFACPVYAWSEPSEELTLSKRLEQMMGMPCPIDPYMVDHLIEGESVLTVGGLTMDLLHIPGHSPDSVCFHLQGDPVVIGGDVLFAGSIGRTDFPNGNHEQLLSGIREKLWPLPDETHVLPGHGPATTIGEEKASNPFLS
jgi:glyoxylase-like metal-dependent hydrolase (beta-lactamase superfamily II)